MEIKQAITFLDHPLVIPSGKTTWADLGCGSGLFTYALANLISHDSTIYAVDKNKIRLQEQHHHPSITIVPQQLDFISEDLPFQNLDGILMANSLHFVKDKMALIQKLALYINPNGLFLIVEYDTNTPNPWVPFPVSYVLLEKLFNEAGYKTVQKIHEAPSAYGRANIYSAVISK